MNISLQKRELITLLFVVFLGKFRQKLFTGTLTLGIIGRLCSAICVISWTSLQCMRYNQEVLCPIYLE